MMAGAGASDGSIGAVPWSLPGNITADDGANSLSNSSPVSTSHYLDATNFGFSIPGGATIQGIEVTADLSRDFITAVDSSIILIKGGVLQTATNRYQYDPWTGIRKWGGPTDLWGGTWSNSDINSSNFGVAMAADIESDTAKVDYVSMKVYYTTGSGSNAFDYYDNATPLNGATISSSGNDPTNSGRTATYQSYQETDPYTNAVAAIPAGNDGIWDFALSASSAAEGKTYCFRTVKSDGSPLDAYSQYPEITITAPVSGPTIDQQLRGGQGVVSGTRYPFNW
jgi:hypothetical protein